MLRNLELKYPKSPLRLDELILKPSELGVLPRRLPLAHQIPLPPHRRQVQSKTDGLLPYAVEICLETRDAAKDVGALVGQNAVRCVLGLDRIAAAADFGDVAS